jgi:hypothetical protein
MFPRSLARVVKFIRIDIDRRVTGMAEPARVHDAYGPISGLV